MCCVSLLPHPSHERLCFLRISLFVRIFVRFLLAWFSSMKMNVLHASTCCSPNSLTTWTNATNSQFSSFIWVALSFCLAGGSLLVSGVYTPHRSRFFSAPFCFVLLSFHSQRFWLAAVVCVSVGLSVGGCVVLWNYACQYFLCVCASSVLYCVFRCFNKSSLFIPG